MAFLEDPARIVPLIISVLAFLTVIAVALPWLQPDLLASRLKVITERRNELSRDRKKLLEARRPGLRRAMESGRVQFMRSVLDKLKLRNVTEQPELRKKLVRAGLRGPAPLITFTFLRVTLPFVLFGLTALLLYGGILPKPETTFWTLVVCACGGAFGYFLPNIMVSNLVTKRQKDIQKKFPDALDLTLICIESGVSLEAAFSRVAEEMAADAPALSEEIAITTAELAFLSNRRQALENLAERTGMPSMRQLVTSLIQSEKYGTPLGLALRVVAKESREARMAKAEEKAASLPAKLTVPMIAFFLPVLFIVMTGPTIIKVMDAFNH